MQTDTEFAGLVEKTIALLLKDLDYVYDEFIPLCDKMDVIMNDDPGNPSEAAFELVNQLDLDVDTVYALRKNFCEETISFAVAKWFRKHRVAQRKK